MEKKATVEELQGSARSAYRASIAREWVKRNHPEVWTKIIALAEQRYPSQHDGKRKNMNDAAMAALKL